MIELKETSDLIDNVIKIGNENIKNINIKDLRAAISVIPVSEYFVSVLKV